MSAALAWLFCTYLLASIPSGLVISTLYGGDLDIRSAGSGNIGATNVLRVYGWRLALPTLLLDLGKGLVPTLAARFWWPEAGLMWAGAVAGTAFLGHCFSVYLEFRGGKGVATGAGGMLAVAPVPALLAMTLWGVLVFAFRRVSVASLVAATSLVGWCWWLEPDALPIVVALAVAIVVTHVSNIRRLVSGEETQIVRHVRMGSASPELEVPVTEQGPAGQDAGPIWTSRPD